MSARAVARRVITRVQNERGFATLVLAAELDAANLTARDRGLATELVYGVFRHRTRLDRALSAMTPRGIKKLAPKLRVAMQVAAYQLLFLDRVPAHAAINDAVTAARRVGGQRMAGFVNGVLRRLARDGEPALPDPTDDAMQYVEVACSLPRWLAELLLERIGEAELVDAAEALNQPPGVVLRVNTLRASLDQVMERLREEAPGAALETAPRAVDAIIARRLGAPEQLASFAEGWWTVQDLGAQLVSRLAPVAPGQTILDACAGVGGKTAHLAQLSGDAATIIAADVSRAKLDRAEAAFRRLGVRSVTTSVIDLRDGSGDATVLERSYEVAVVDAPCSGLGVLRRHPEAKWRCTPEGIAEMVALQRSILDTVARLVRPGGALVYSVCTFTAAEGPEQVAAFLGRHPGWQLDRELTTWPHRDDADAFYAARLIAPARPYATVGP